MLEPKFISQSYKKVSPTIYELKIDKLFLKIEKGYDSWHGHAVLDKSICAESISDSPIDAAKCLEETIISIEYNISIAIKESYSKIYKVLIIKDNDVWHSYCIDIGAESEGDSSEQVIEMLKEKILSTKKSQIKPSNQEIENTFNHFSDSKNKNPNVLTGYATFNVNGTFCDIIIEK